jgi:hypothetical protein
MDTDCDETLVALAAKGPPIPLRGGMKVKNPIAHMGHSNRHPADGAGDIRQVEWVRRRSQIIAVAVPLPRERIRRSMRVVLNFGARPHLCMSTCVRRFTAGGACED